MDNIWINISSILFSGIMGVILTIFVQRKFSQYDIKYKLLIDFVENRFDLRGTDFTKAINKIYIVFHKNDKVVSALNDFHRVIVEKSTFGVETNRKLRNIYVAMCDDLKIDPMKEEMFYNVFNIKN